MDYIYNIINNEVHIKEYIGKRKKVYIPETIDGFKVSKVCTMSFFCNDNIIEIHFPKKIEIENNAIINCSNLKKIFIEEKSIFSKFIEDCENISIFCANHTIYNKIKKTYKNSLNCLLDYVFEYKFLRNLGGYEITKFKESPNNKNVIIPNTFNGKKIVRLSNSLFVDKKIESLTFNEYITTIPYSCFMNCKNLKKIKNLKNIKYIDVGAFQNTPLLKIDWKKFESLEMIDNYAFFFSGIKDFYLDHKFSLGTSVFSHSKIEKANLKNLIDLSIPDATFQKCQELTKVYLNKDILNINRKAFENCINLNYINISNIEKLENKCFFNCKKLKLKIHNKIKRIGIDSLYKVTIQENLTLKRSVEIGEASFAGTNGLKTLIIDNINILPIDCFRESSVKEVLIKGKLEKIDFKCFFDSKLETINLENVNNIRSNAFSYTNIQEIKLTCSYLDFGAFSYCKKLKKANLEESTIEILPISLFNGCKNLSNVIFPKKLKKIRKYSLDDTKVILSPKYKKMEDK